MQKKVASEIKRFDYLQKTVIDALGKLQGEPEKLQESGHYEVLLAMDDKIKKFGSLLKGRKPTIGVFGCPSIEKSALLNVFLGVDIMPINGLSGTVRFCTEFSYKKQESAEPFEITVEYEDKNNTPKTFHRTLEDGKAELNRIYEEAKKENPVISRIDVKGPFKSYIGEDFIFVDTPGMVHEADKNNALAIFDKIDVVIYCMKLDNEEGKDAQFYNEYIKKYEPINVITTSEKKADKKLQEKYGLLTVDTVFALSQKELEIINKHKDNGIKKTAKTKGFKNLKDKILKKAGNKNLSEIKIRINRLEDDYNKLKMDAEKKGIELPKLLEKKKKRAGKIILTVIIIAIVIIVLVLILGG